MKNIFKIMSLVLILVLAIGVLAACNGDDKTDDKGGNTSTDGGNDNTNGGNDNTDDGNDNTDDGNNGDTNGGNEDSGDKSATFKVTFKYVDPNGNPMPDAEGETEKVRKVKYGKEAKDMTVGEPQAFADYVVIGWNADLEKAKAGEVDENCVKNIKAEKVVYSVVRLKKTYTVTFLKADGETVFQTLKLKEGTEIDATIERPVEMGTYFKAWVVVGEPNSSVSCIRDDCTFVANVGKTDGTIGKVAAGSITVDGIKDEAYMTSGAYLPVNTTLQSDRSQGRAEATIDADTYLVWDGDYIYMLMEVSDKSLVGRNGAYVKGGVDAYLNDAVEIWYNFEQDTTQTKNETRVGLDAMGTAKYALPRSVYKDKTTGIGGGRSTHYDDITFAVRNYLLGDSGDDLSKTGYVGDATYSKADKEAGLDEPEYKASYIVEFKFPAWTEGAADTTKNADIKTGLLPGRDAESNNIADYAFTSGTKLVAGDFVRFNLQINDLMISQAEMTGGVGTYFWDCPSDEIAYGWTGAADANHTSMLYATDGKGNITGMANTTPRFSASGATQRELQYYIMFSLSDSAEGATIVKALGNDTVEGSVVPVMYKADGSVYKRS